MYNKSLNILNLLERELKRATVTLMKRKFV